MLVFFFAGFFHPHNNNRVYLCPQGGYEADGTNPSIEDVEELTVVSSDEEVL